MTHVAMDWRTLGRISPRLAVGDAGCWEWTGARSNGYAVMHGRVRLVHRAVYTILVGPIPAGLQIDHLCRNRACVNPTHLEVVTNAENGRRGVAGEVNRARQLAITHCPQGHAYSPGNTGPQRLPTGVVARYCRECRNAARRMARAEGRGTRSRTSA